MILTTLGLIEEIYGTVEDTLINLCSKPYGKGFERLASISPNNIKELLPLVAPHLKQDGFFSPNGFWRSENTTSKKTGLPVPYGADDNLQRLNGLMVDVDTGRSNLPKNDPHSETTQDAMCRAMDNCIKYGYPPPTYWAESGQGFYMYWLFSEWMKAWRENVSNIQQAQEKLGIVMHPAADPNTTTPRQVFRIPGTRHHENGNEAKWYHGPNGLIKHESQELLERLNIKTKKQRLIVTQRPGSCPNRLPGMIALNSNRASDIRELHRSRGGFKEGMRRHALTTYAVFRLLEGASPFDVGPELEQMAAGCQPAFPSHANDCKAHKILQDAMDLKKIAWKWLDETLASRLGVTPEEAETLNLKQLRPQDSEAKAKARASRSLNEGRPERAKRQEFVTGYVKANPKASIRDVLAATTAAGFKASRGTIQRDRASL